MTHVSPARRAASIAERLRDALRLAPASVAIVTAGRGADALGITATSVTPVSLDPPMLLACVNRALRLNTLVRGAGCFRVSYLRRDQEHVARAFAGAIAGAERFTIGAWDLDAPGAAALPAALISVACTLDTALDYGTHSVFIGRVDAVRSAPSDPLLYCDGRYRGLD